MKKLFIVFIAGLSVACNMADSKGTAADQQKSDSATLAEVNNPANHTTVEWLDSTTQNLGKIREGQVVEVSWRVKNTGNKPLVIAQVNPACGCTVADKPEEPIAPGGTGTIKAKFDSKGRMGTNDKSVEVIANIKDNQASHLRFMVDVTKE